MADGDKFSSPPPRPACLTFSSPYGNNVDTSFLVIEFWWLYPRPSLNTIQWRTQNAKWYFKAHIAQNEWTLLLVIHGRIRKERALCWENSVNPDTGNLIVLKPLPRAVNSFCAVSKMSGLRVDKASFAQLWKKWQTGLLNVNDVHTIYKAQKINVLRIRRTNPSALENWETNGHFLYRTMKLTLSASFWKPVWILEIHEHNMLD